jgi:hypothetical protein
VDPSQKGYREGVIIDEILHHGRRIPMGNERLVRIMEGSSRTTKGQAFNKGQTTNKSRFITKEGYLNSKYKSINSAHETNRGDHNNKEEDYPQANCTIEGPCRNYYWHNTKEGEHTFPRGSIPNT